ncbi:ribosomal-processing cysteine protease Prp [Anaerospora hongkongensis]|uniref:ribosomal-processing cysteine protease Prp n=1 Tax=Anaerospora hongkongensis TaxID=244830 RepID=UPI00289C9314|nr:ribosomal-processing cysteine protease Prp [Anaerospora hongkongensis]
MIKVQITREAEESIIGFRVSGHANTAPKGQDIVCAGVSALTQAAVLGLDRCLQRQMKLEITSGRLLMELTGPPDERTQAILETMLLGIKEIASTYPKSVQIQEHRR